MSDKQKIKAHLNAGFAYINGLRTVRVDNIPMKLGSSQDRTMRKIATFNDKYSYFMIEPTEGNQGYKAWIKSLPRCVQILPINGKYRIRAYVSTIKYVQSVAFDTQREALQAIKNCGGNR